MYFGHTCITMNWDYSDISFDCIGFEIFCIKCWQNDTLLLKVKSRDSTASKLHLRFNFENNSNESETNIHVHV